MSRRKPLSRCETCKMRKEICICAEAAICREVTQDFSTKIFVIMHHREKHLTTNTARLAQLGIETCKIRMRGLPNSTLNTEGFFEEARKTLLLFPSDDAAVLSSEYLSSIDKPINLLVPDGSWRQAAKTHKRELHLKDVARVKLPLGKLSEYKLRREPKAEGLATFEAIMRALEIIEGQHGQPELKQMFTKMVEGTLRSRMGGPLPAPPSFNL